METALWNLVLDDLLKVFKNSDNIKAFADDASLLSTGKNICGIKINTKKHSRQNYEMVQPKLS